MSLYTCSILQIMFNVCCVCALNILLTCFIKVMIMKLKVSYDGFPSSCVPYYAFHCLCLSGLFQVDFAAENFVDSHFSNIFIQSKFLWLIVRILQLVALRRQETKKEAWQCLSLFAHYIVCTILFLVQVIEA